MEKKETKLLVLDIDGTLTNSEKQITENTRKGIINIIERGCRSALGCAQMPWDFVHQEFPVNEEEQANFYESSLSVMSNEDWFMGYFWWDWSTWIYSSKEEAQKDKGFNIHLKKAEEVIKKWYSKN